MRSRLKVEKRDTQIANEKQRHWQQNPNLLNQASLGTFVLVES